MIKREAQIFLDSRLVRTKLITIRMKSSQVLAAHLNLLVLQDNKLVIWSNPETTFYMNYASFRYICLPLPKQ